MLPLLFVLMSAAASAISVPAGKLSDKIGRKPVLAIGWLLFGAMCAGFLLFPVEYAIPASFALFGIYGLHYGIVTTIQSPLVADLSPKRIRGSAIGLYQTVIGLCALPAGVIAGMLWEVNPVIPFLTGLCISITSAILLFLFVREKGFKKHEAK
jgi:MFS family permease